MVVHVRSEDLREAVQVAGCVCSGAPLYCPEVGIVLAVVGRLVRLAQCDCEVLELRSNGPPTSVLILRPLHHRRRRGPEGPTISVEDPCVLVRGELRLEAELAVPPLDLWIL